MKRNFEEKLDEAIKEASILLEGLRKARSMETYRSADHLLQTSMRAERLAEKLRRLISGTAFPPAFQRYYCHCLTEVHDIQIHYEEQEGIFQVTLPGLLPHRKSRGSDYLYKPLYLALQEWCKIRLQQGGDIPEYKEAVVCFVHVYGEGWEGGRIRDHDNLEEKQVVDALGTFFLLSDGGMFLDIYHTSIMGTGGRTLIFLVGRRQFPGWIQAEGWKALVSKNGSFHAGSHSIG